MARGWIVRQKSDLRSGFAELRIEGTRASRVAVELRFVPPKAGPAKCQTFKIVRPWRTCSHPTAPQYVLPHKWGNNGGGGGIVRFADLRVGFAALRVEGLALRARQSNKFSSHREVIGSRCARYGGGGGIRPSCCLISTSFCQHLQSNQAIPPTSSELLVESSEGHF